MIVPQHVPGLVVRLAAVDPLILGGDHLKLVESAYLWFRILSSGFGVWGLGFGVWGSNHLRLVGRASFPQIRICVAWLENFRVLILRSGVPRGQAHGARQCK
jgi:hypothetical protein